jgi:hypothetical protein
MAPHRPPLAAEHIPSTPPEMKGEIPISSPTVKAANSPGPARLRAVSIARWSGVLLSVVSVLFAIVTYLGVWNYLLAGTFY